MQIGAQDPTAEQCKGVADVADGVARNRLEYDIVRLRDNPSIINSSIYLDVVPSIGARWVDLKATKPVVQERLFTACQYTDKTLKNVGLQVNRSRCARRVPVSRGSSPLQAGS